MTKIIRECGCGIVATWEDELELFAPDITQPYGRKNKCHACRKKQRRENGLMSAYGITLDEYTKILMTQDGKCKLCLTDKPGGKGVFHVDHNHNTGHIRGLLCHGCNTGLGLFGDSADRLKAAAYYLEENGSYGND